jgi:hypothetical protein
VVTVLLDRDGSAPHGTEPDASGPRCDVHGIWEPCATTLVLVIVLAVTGIRGADYPAHHLRALLWQESAAPVWNFHWYGGHPTATYGILTPPVVALMGPFAVVASAALASTLCFSRLTRELLPGQTTVLANHVFAAVVTTNVVVGRVAFGLGLAIALAALVAWARRLTVVAIGASVLATLASPVAGLFLALAGVAVAVTRLREGRRITRAGLVGTAVAVAAMSPLAATSALFETAGRFPFRGGQFVASAVVLVAVGRTSRSPTVRIGAALAGGISIMVFVVPNPLGGNIVRLAQIVAVPIGVLALDRRGRGLPRSPWLLIVAAVGWSLSPGVVAALDSAGDPSSMAAYHQPLIDAIAARNADGRPVGRVEIPFTVNHWESFYVAAAVPYVRGWERQIDIARNAVLYDPALDLASYRRWLDDNAVRWIAVPDVPIDDDGGGRREHALVAARGAGPVPWLTLVWSDPHWRLLEVADYVPIVDRPAELVSQDADRIVVRALRPVTVRIRYAYTDRLSISGGACLAASADGRIVARLPEPGEYALLVGWVGGDHSCDPHSQPRAPSLSAPPDVGYVRGRERHDGGSR